MNYRGAFPPQPPGGRQLTDRVSSGQLLAAHPAGKEGPPAACAGAADSSFGASAVLPVAGGSVGRSCPATALRKREAQRAPRLASGRPGSLQFHLTTKPIIIIIILHFPVQLHIPLTIIKHLEIN